MKKRILSLLLALVLAVSLLPVSAVAEAPASLGAAQEVPADKQLSQLVFRNGIMATAAEFPLEPQFEPGRKAYTVVVPDTVNGLNGFAAWATLADGASGKITANYTPVGVSKAMKITLTSGKANGQPLGRLFAANDFVGNTLQINVGDVTAYEITVVRCATLKSLAVTDQNSNALELTPAFKSGTYDYSLHMDKDATLQITPAASVPQSAQVTVNGTKWENGDTSVKPEWNAQKTASVVVEVSGGAAQSTKYTLTLTQEPEVERIEIVTLPVKTAYNSGDMFDATGMTVKAYFTDSSEKIIGSDALTCSPTGPLTSVIKEIEVAYKGAKTTQKITVSCGLSGAGTSEDPYLLQSEEDFARLRREVSYGNSFKGSYFKITQDVIFSADWEPIGCLKDGVSSAENGINMLPFSGNIDGGGKILTFAAGSKPLFNYVREASVSSFKIYAPYMDGYALVDQYTVDYGEDGRYSDGTGGSYAPGAPDTINISRVTLLSGSIIKNGGFVGGFASGGNTVNMTDCVVEKGVKIGCNADGTSAEGSYVGSFAGMVSGTFKDCVSYAEVYGVNRVGGIIGYKGQSMGFFNVLDCAFYGKVVASGDYVGGIVGSGYSAPSAPNTMCVVIKNCKSGGTVTGKDYVGGILGNESAVQCWDNGIGEILKNSFDGKLTASGDHVGGIIGNMTSLNKYTIVEGNYYSAQCGAVRGIGSVQYVDTNCASHETASGAIYFDTSKSLPNIKGVEFKNHNRTDDPLGKDAVKLCRSTNESLLPDDNGAGTPATGDTGVLVWVIALPMTILTAAFVLKRKEREA